MERNCEACEKYVTSEDGKTKGCSQWYCDKFTVTTEEFIADIFRDKEPRLSNVIIRMTSDKKGKSLSFQASNVIIGIPLEKVEDIIRIAEKGEK